MTKRSETPGSGKPTPAAPKATGSASKTPASATKTAAAAPKTTAKNTRPLREYKSRAEREAQIQRWVVLGSIVAAALIAVIVVGAAVYEWVIVPRQAVATVDDQTINVSEFENRVRLERALLNDRLNSVYAVAANFGSDQYLQYIFGQEPYKTWLNEAQVSDQLGNRVLNDMIDDIVVRKKAQELGVTVGPEDVQKQIEQFFGYDPQAVAQEAEATETPTPTITPTPFVSPTPSATPTITPTPEAQPTVTTTPFASATPQPTLNATERFEQYNTARTSTIQHMKDTASVSDADINAYFEMQALRAKLAEKIGVETAPAQTYEVQLRHILVAGEDDANDVLTALRGGASFADLAAAVSTDTGSAQNGGFYDWAAASGYVPEFADAARTGKIGDFLGPIKTEFGYHVMQVLGRRPAPETEADAEQLQATALTDYLQKLRDSGEVNVQTYDVWTSNIPSEPAFSPPA